MLRALRFFRGFHGGDARELAAANRAKHLLYVAGEKSTNGTATEFDEELFPHAERDARIAGDCGRQSRTTHPGVGGSCRRDCAKCSCFANWKAALTRKLPAITSMPIGTVMSAFARARQRLQRSLTQGIQRKIRRPSVSCELTHSVLHGYMDGELDAARAADFERHLVSCVECVASLEAQETVRSSIHRAGLSERAPSALRRRFEAESGAAARGASNRMVAPQAPAILALAGDARQRFC